MRQSTIVEIAAKIEVSNEINKKNEKKYKKTTAMNNKLYNELSSLCISCIEGWKKDNWHEPIDIEYGNYIEHCRVYGEQDIQELYEQFLDDVEEAEAQKALRMLERELLVINVGEEEAEQIYRQAERKRIGARIAELRQECGMTQQVLADAVGLQRPHISRIETGRYSVGLDTIAAIAAALGKKFDFVDV